MEPTGFGVLTLLISLPLIGALVLSFVPPQYGAVIKGIAMSFAIATFGISLGVLADFNSASYHFQLREFVSWIPQLGINYSLGIDGISIWLVVLTTLLMVVSTWFSLYVNKRVKPYFILMLLLETAMLGLFVSLDMILFYVFFELTLIPMALMIWIWGGANRNYAAVKFFIYTFAASIFMLVGMIFMAGLYRQATGDLSFSILAIQEAVANGTLWNETTLQIQTLLFVAFTVAFMVKCPMFPFHTWLPDAHTEAPTAGSIILAGVLLKMGTYGFLRFSLPMFPDVLQYQIPWIMGLAVVGIIYGAVVAAVQSDIKKLVAYSSVAHMGFVVLGIFSLTHTGITGGAFQQLAHGISTGGLFLLIGLLYERIHTRKFSDLGGLKAQMPIFAALFLIIMLSSVGLPGTNGFVGEFLAMMGAFEAAWNQAFGLNVWYSVIAGTGVILAAVYLLVMFMRAFYGQNQKPLNTRLKDLKPHEIALVGVLILFVFWGGLYPNTFLKPMEKALNATRMMALNPEGQRPTWNDQGLEIDEQGNLVQVERNPDNPMEYVAVFEIVRDAGFHFPTRNVGGERIRTDLAETGKETLERTL